MDYSCFGFYTSNVSTFWKTNAIPLPYSFPNKSFPYHEACDVGDDVEMHNGDANLDGKGNGLGNGNGVVGCIGHEPCDVGANIGLCDGTFAIC